MTGVRHAIGKVMGKAKDAVTGHVEHSKDAAPTGNIQETDPAVRPAKDKKKDKKEKKSKKDKHHRDEDKDSKKEKKHKHRAVNLGHVTAPAAADPVHITPKAPTPPPFVIDAKLEKTISSFEKFLAEETKLDETSSADLSAEIRLALSNELRELRVKLANPRAQDTLTHEIDTFKQRMLSLAKEATAAKEAKIPDPVTVIAEERELERQQNVFKPVPKTRTCCLFSCFTRNDSVKEEKQNLLRKTP